MATERPVRSPLRVAHTFIGRESIVLKIYEKTRDPGAPDECRNRPLRQPGAAEVEAGVEREA